MTKITKRSKMTKTTKKNKIDDTDYVDLKKIIEGYKKFGGDTTTTLFTFNEQHNENLNIQLPFSLFKTMIYLSNALDIEVSCKAYYNLGMIEPKIFVPIQRNSTTSTDIEDLEYFKLRGKKNSDKYVCDIHTHLSMPPNKSTTDDEHFIKLSLINKGIIPCLIFNDDTVKCYLYGANGLVRGVECGIDVYLDKNNPLSLLKEFSNKLIDEYTLSNYYMGDDTQEIEDRDYEVIRKEPKKRLLSIQNLLRK